MIGNDIVDRAWAKQESNWQRRGFLDKVFTAYEQQLIYAANDPECMVWVLWSMKESAYKAHIRETEKRIFNPQKISCTLTMWTGETARGEVFYEKQYQTISSVTPYYITSVALSTDSFHGLQQVIIPFETSNHHYQSATVRSSIVTLLAVNLSIKDTDIRIDNDLHNIPTVVIDCIYNYPLHIPITLSHHGLFGAYCFQEADIVAHQLSTQREQLGKI